MKINIIILIILLIIAFYIGQNVDKIDLDNIDGNLNNEITKYQKVSIMELDLNPEKYDKMNISIIGTAKGFIWEHVRIENEGGFYIPVKPFISVRSFDYGSVITGKKGAEYIIKGTFVNDQPNKYISKKMHIQATEPIVKS
tara:strand:- start:2487 stop:2909 length:423 start_codon:yes stop_codon:yes gene_type:complete